MKKNPATRKKSKKSPLPLRTEHRMLTRRRILDAAHDCMAENGYAKTTMEDVAQTANVSRTTLYQHFTTKSDVMEVLQQEVMESFINSFEQTVAEALSRADVQALVEGLRDHELEHLGFLEASREATSIESSIRELSDAIFINVMEFIIGRVPKKVKNAGIDVVRARAWICFSATDETIRRAIDPSWKLDMDIAVNELTELWCKLFQIKT